MFIMLENVEWWRMPCCLLLLNHKIQTNLINTEENSWFNEHKWKTSWFHVRWRRESSVCLHDLNRMNPVSKHLLQKDVNMSKHGYWDECLSVCHFLTCQEPPESGSAPSHVRHIRPEIKVELRAENLFNFPWCNLLLILQACSPRNWWRLWLQSLVSN